MNKIKLSESKLKEAVSYAIEKILGEEQALTLNAVPDNVPILEMARINKKEMSIFPFNSWEIKIWSNDHNPPHFHILRNDWNVSFDIESGSVINVEKKGENIEDYQYMLGHIKEWLDSPCAIQPKITNRENAFVQWEQLHDD